MLGSKLNFSKKCILGTSTCKMVAIKNPSPPQAYLEWNCGLSVCIRESSGDVQIRNGNHVFKCTEQEAKQVWYWSHWQSGNKR